jgi:hypothetical protein
MSSSQALAVRQAEVVVLLPEPVLEQVLPQAL